MDFDLLIWLFCIAITLHNLEEAIWLPGWSNVSKRFHRPVDKVEFRFAVAVLTLMAYVIAFFSMTGGKGGIGAYLICGYALAMLLNVVFPHIPATLILRRYAPGTATAMLLNLPVSLMLLHKGIEEGFIEKGIFIYTGPLCVAGILLIIPGLFFIAKRWLKPRLKP
ncbi:MAG: HXXEE domain-containing protein [Desulfobacteraceae bacterium]|nr:HXXEE domain-containing protein [Desulfobacteraceae bacterium]